MFTMMNYVPNCTQCARPCLPQFPNSDLLKVFCWWPNTLPSPCRSERLSIRRRSNVSCTRCRCSIKSWPWRDHFLPLRLLPLVWSLRLKLWLVTCNANNIIYGRASCCVDFCFHAWHSPPPHLCLLSSNPSPTWFDCGVGTAITPPP